MNPAQERPHWRRLGAELLRLREFAGLTQRAMAGTLNVSQTTIDRIESGGPEGRPPSWPKVHAWAQQCAQARPDMDALRELAELALDEHLLYRNLMSGGLAPVQEEVADEEAVSMLIRTFCPSFVPGLLQTEEYARRILAITNYRRAAGLDAAVQARLRRQEIRRDGKHRLEFIMKEDGLRWPPGPSPILADQLTALASAVAEPSVTFSVIRTGVQTYALPDGGFVLYEERTGGEEPIAAVEERHTRPVARKPEDVATYREQYDLLHRSAVHGDEAVALVREVAASL